MRDDKPLREFKGPHDECDDWLFNNGFLYDRGTWVHPKLVAIRMKDRNSGLWTVKLFKHWKEAKK